jgi:hypothetical protein
MKQRTYLNATITEIEEALSRDLPVDRDLATLIVGYFQRRYLQQYANLLVNREVEAADAYHEGYADGWKDAMSDNPTSKGDPR